MLGKLIKLAIVVLVLHGTWRAGSAYYVFYRFQDGLQEIAQFGGNRTDEALRAQVARLARELDVPVSPQAVEIRRFQGKVFIDAGYQTHIQFLPRTAYPWTFSASVSAWVRP
jgi:hypothetical protein